MVSKICSKCHTEKPIDLFNYRSKEKDTRRSECKDCLRKMHMSRKIKNYEKKKSRLDVWRSENKSKLKLYSKEYRRKNEHKRLAHEKVRNITCPYGYEKHHWSYNEYHYCDVLILTIREHRLLHKIIYLDLDKLKYRCKKTNKLLNKKDHINLINEIKKVIQGE